MKHLEWLIRHRHEGEACTSIINWDKTEASRIMIYTKIWRVYIYFRVRSATQLARMDQPARKYIFSINWRPFKDRCGVSYDFDTMSYNINGIWIEVHDLIDLVARWKYGTSRNQS